MFFVHKRFNVSRWLQYYIRTILSSYMNFFKKIMLSLEKICSIKCMVLIASIHGRVLHLIQHEQSKVTISCALHGHLLVPVLLYFSINWCFFINKLKIKH